MRASIKALMDYAIASKKIYMPVEIKVDGNENDDFSYLEISQSSTAECLFVTPYSCNGVRLCEPLLAEKIDGEWIMKSNYHTNSPEIHEIDSFDRSFLVANN